LSQTYRFGATFCVTRLVGITAMSWATTMF
jgi:hypothetical protein